MKREDTNYVLVGTFVLGVLVAFLVLLGVLTGRTGPTDAYHALFDNITGVDYGTEVTYEGFKVGQVKDITPIQGKDQTRYRVDFTVRSKWKIPADSVARIHSTGLLSAITIDIREGEQQTYLESGDQLQGEINEDLFAALGEAAGEITRLAAKLHQSAESITELFGPENRQRVTDFIARMDRSAAKLETLLVNSNAVVADNKDDLHQAVRDLRTSLEVISEHVDSIAMNASATSRNLNEFSRRIRNNPGILIRSSAPADPEPGQGGGGE